MIGELLRGACLLALLVPAAGVAQSILPGEAFSSIETRAISAPNPVLGADGRVHLAYEIMVVNPSHTFVALDKVEAVDPLGVALWSLEGDALKAMTTRWDGAAAIPPGGAATVFMDVSFAPETALPATVAARFTVTRQVPDKNGEPAPMPDGGLVPATVSFTGATVPVGAPAVAIDPPLRGAGWVAVNGCCDSITSHRGAVMAVDGALEVPERFAIDWVRLDADGRLFTGDAARLESYAYYGEPVLAVADGVVVNTYDEAEAQTPGAPRQGLTLPGFGGNIVVLDIGGGNFAFYAHMQKGSLKVKLGDRVTSGQELGLLGNTGNSDAPHLHFHVMDGKSPLAANGLPYVFRSFTGIGALADPDDDGFETGAPMKIDPTLTGPHQNQLPLNNQVVDFGR